MPSVIIIVWLCRVVRIVYVYKCEVHVCVVRAEIKKGGRSNRESVCVPLGLRQWCICKMVVTTDYASSL